MTHKRTDSSRVRNATSRLRRFSRLTSAQRNQLLLNRYERRFRSTTLRSGPRMLDLVPSHRCNLRCVGCVHYDNEGPGDLELPFFRAILEESAPWVVQYRFCSLGEPLMNKDMPEMLELAARAGVGCNLMTNGTLLTPELAEHLIARARLDILTFSIDGATAETCERLRRGLKFDRLLEAVSSVVEAKRRHGVDRPVVQANAIAMKDNIDELSDLVRLAGSVGIEDLNVHFLTVEGEVASSSSLFDDPALQKRAFDDARRVGQELGVVLHLPPDIEEEGFGARCYLPWDTLIIDTDGTARMCYFSWEESVGNVIDDGGIRAVWNNALYQKVRGTIETECPFYKYCAHCGYRVGYSRREAHEGKSDANAHLFSFDWERPDAPPRPSGSRLANPDRRGQ
ncbi:MAG: radical SAM protein [Candidatus Eisenbacteria bacterium]